MSESREHVKTIFGKALDIRSEDERAEYLDLFDLFWRKGGDQDSLLRLPAAGQTFYVTGVLNDDDTVSIGRLLLSESLSPTIPDPDSGRSGRSVGACSP